MTTTTDKDALIELAARLEAATGPSRSLDNMIRLATNNGCAFGDDPAFTASLDAAMTLNPGWLLRGLHQEPSYWYCDFISSQADEPAKGHAKTAALALCAAALHSRTLSKGDE